MKTGRFTYKVGIVINFTNDELELLCKCCGGHYDGTVEDSALQGGFLYGWLRGMHHDHDLAVGDRVRRRGQKGEGTVKGCPMPNVSRWPERVVVRWDEFGEEFDDCCNDNPKRDHVSPKSLIRLTKYELWDIADIGCSFRQLDICAKALEQPSQAQETEQVRKARWDLRFAIMEVLKSLNERTGLMRACLK